MLKLPEIEIKPELKPLYELFKDLYKNIFELGVVWYSHSTSDKTVGIIRSVDSELMLCMQELEAGVLCKPKFNSKTLESCFKKPRFKHTSNLDFDSLKEVSMLLYEKICVFEYDNLRN